MNFIKLPSGKYVNVDLVTDATPKESDDGSTITRVYITTVEGGSEYNIVLKDYDAIAFEEWLNRNSLHLYRRTL